ncbi:hypothetical protein F5878DRAFT_636322 [Lentinula raphanica]|uniref:Uncharacterized protein n=1 Tax=Lentinula raphanica TaxID=153919 RepID=A0AA38NVC3_9AGAR|nr:hypothetical protein F5878DRAFT_636322 [Lentinula raphanica]
MTDLTVLSSSHLPLYPLASASRSSFFSNYVAGASSSKVNLVRPAAQKSIPSKPERPTRLNLQPKPQRRESEEGGGAGAGHSEQSSEEDEEEVESPDSYVGSQTTGWNRSGQNWQLNSSSPTPSKPSTSQNLTPTLRGRSETQRHRPTRSRSAPPIQTTFSEPLSSTRRIFPTTSTTAAADVTSFDLQRTRRYTSGSTYTSSTESTHSSPSSSFSSPYSWSGHGYGKSRNGDILRPPPPLHRPTTFWRRTPRSGVTASSYSPSSHLIRRSTFVAAGLPFEKPMADISALGVESRIKAQFDEDNARAKVSEVFWEVVVQR